MAKIKEFKGEYRFLSNFYPVPGGLYSVDDEIRYPTAEHSYQGAKTHDKFEKIMIKQLASAGAAKKAGRDLKYRDDWKFVREELMYEILRLCFHIVYE